jgi:nucleoside-diphosphate-sugar epimerase
MNLSIYGSTGYIGSNFCKLIKSNKALNFETISKGIYKSRGEEILYFISTNNNYNIFDNPHLDINTNLNYLISVLEANRNTCKTFNFISSWFVYGNTSMPASTSSICNPTGFYSITKKCAEDLLISYCKTFKINYRIIRLCNVYGNIDKKASKKKNALHFLINKLVNNEEISLYEKGNIIRDYMHVTDICKAINLIINKSMINKIYNIGSNNPKKIGEIILYAKEFLKSKSKINSIETPGFHKIVQVKDMYLDTQDLTALGFKAEITIEKGIEDLCVILKKK